MADQDTKANGFGAVLAGIGAFVGGLTARQKMIGGGVIAAVLLLVLVSSWAGDINPSGRAITVNGQRMTDEQISYLDMLAGGPVPNGNYWLDPNTGLWGYLGNPQPMGQIGAGGQQGQGQGQGGAPHWADVGQNYRGPFGDYMADGQGCAAVNGILTGNC